MTGLWDLPYNTTAVFTTPKHKNALLLLFSSLARLTFVSEARSTLPPVCLICAKVSKSIECALENLPPGFDDIYSDAPGYVKVADVGSFYRPWYRARSFIDSLAILLYKTVTGYILPPCNLCRMLSDSMIWDHADKDPIADELQLHRFNSQMVYRPIPRKADSPPEALRRDSPLFLSAVPRNQANSSSTGAMVDGQCRRFGFPIVRRRGPIPYAICQPRLISRRFDSEQARKWLRYCRNHHHGPCLSKPSVVTNLCLIDCRLRTVVEAPTDAEYVALSYCWGQLNISSPGWFQWAASVHSVTNPPVPPGKENHEILRNLPENVPEVISDAMLVTISMGYSYLWVDRYCIDQNSSTKHTQISQMDTIYQRAELTIIAAAGEDPSYGIPGVGMRPRRQQLTSSAGNLDFWSTMTHPHRALQSSAWFKRAWTFQEGLLSRRRLIFTDDQAYYECASMNCLESMDSDLDSLHTEDKTKFRECLRSGFFGNNNQFTTGGFGEVLQTPTGNLGLLRQMIEIFTDRDMTYDTDSLNAFVGVLRRFEKSPTTTRSIWGLPLLSAVGDDGADISKEADDSFMSSLAWSHETKLNDAHELVHPRRRDGFPSWSWCGWAGSIQHMQLPPNSLLKSIKLEDNSGALFTPSACLAHVGTTQGPELKPSALWITGFVIPPSAFSITPKKTETGTDRELRIWGFAKAYASLSVGSWDREDVEESLMKGESRQCVCLGDCDDHNTMTFLVLERQGDDWQRIGTIWMYMEPVDDGQPRSDGGPPRDDQPLEFWKKWLEYETKMSVPIDDVLERRWELPVTTFRVI